MGKLDTAAKKYLGKQETFADVFNYLLFDGKQVIKPNELTELDSNQVAVLFKEKDIKVKDGGVDMCEALERRYQKEKVEGAIQGMRAAGMNDSDIAAKIMELYHVTMEYVQVLLSPKAAAQ